MRRKKAKNSSYKFEFRHYKQVGGNKTIVGLVNLANAELYERGISDSSLNVGWDYKVLSAVVTEYGVSTTAGIIVWEYLPHALAVFVDLSYVRPTYRRQGIYARMWDELVKTVMVEFPDVLEIRSGISVHNIAMRHAASKTGRVETAVIWTHFIHRKPPSSTPK